MGRVTQRCGNWLTCLANNIGTLVLTALATITVGALGYSYFEDYKWYQSIEWAVQSMTSTGYGNYPAQTMGGSLFSSVFMLWGVIIMLSLIVAVFVDAFRKDEHKLTDAEQDWIATTLTNIAEQLHIDVDPYPDSNKEN